MTNPVSFVVNVVAVGTKEMIDIDDRMRKHDLEDDGWMG